MRGLTSIAEVALHLHSLDFTRCRSGDSRRGDRAGAAIVGELER